MSCRFSRRLRRFGRDQQGTAAIIVASGLSMSIALGALAVDLGYVYMQSRKLQGIADLAAMAAARDLAHADAAAQATARANGWDHPLTVAVTTGAYKQDAAVAASARFTPGGATPDAARVRVSGAADLFFGQVILGKPTLNLTRQATAARAELASFSIGTRLAALDGGVANRLLSTLTGSTVSLTVMDYNALAGAKVDLFKYASALRTQADLEGVSFNKALQADLSTGEALSVLGDVLETQGDTTAAASARRIATAAGTSTPANLDHLVDLGPYGKQDRLSVASTKVEVSALELADAMLMLAKEGRVLKLDFDGGVPGVADLDLWLAIGQRPNNSPWLSVDRSGDVIVRTAQMRLYARAEVLGAIGILGLKPIEAPILVEAAPGEAKLASMECPFAGADQAATLSVRPGVAKLTLGHVDTNQLNQFGTPLTPTSATLLDLGLIKATGSGHVDVGGATWKNVRFSRGEIDSGTVKSVATDDIARATVATLLQNTSLTVTTPAFGIGAGVVTTAVRGALTALAAPLDGVLNSLTTLLGVRLGEVDVKVHGLRCREAALVA